MRRTLVLLVLLLSAFAADPAAAGSAADPDLVDRCGLEENVEDRSVVTSELDVCAAWLSSTVDDELVTLTASLAVDGDAEGTDGGFYLLQWATGDCWYSAQRDEGNDVSQVVATCGEGTTERCDVPIVQGRDCYVPPTSTAYPVASTEDGSTITWTLRFDGALADLAPAHAPGTALAGPDVLTSNQVGPVFAFVFGCSGSSPSQPTDGCFSAAGDLALGGRGHVIGS